MQGILEAILDQFENSILQGSCTGFLFEVRTLGSCSRFEHWVLVRGIGRRLVSEKNHERLEPSTIYHSGWLRGCCGKRKTPAISS